MKNGAQPFFTHPSRRWFVLSVFCLGMILVFHEPVRRHLLSFLRLPFRVTTTLIEAVGAIPRVPSLVRENRTLKAELTQRQLEVAQLREMVRHIQQSQVFLKDVSSHSGVVASVIARSTLPMQQTVLLDKGTRDGLSLESLVVDAEGIVGRVIELHRATCLVMLLTDPDSRIGGLVERSRETGLLVGRGQGTCELIYLDAEADIKEGDRIVTVGFSAAIPKGLPIGTVVRVLRHEQVGSTTVWVKPAAHLGQLEELFCLLPQSTSG